MIDIPFLVRHIEGHCTTYRLLGARFNCLFVRQSHNDTCWFSPFLCDPVQYHDLVGKLERV